MTPSSVPPGTLPEPAVPEPAVPEPAVPEPARSAPPAIRVRRGAGYWLRGYTSMLGFEVGNQRQVLPIVLVIQVVMSAGMAVMYGFYFGGTVPRLAATYITSGIPALALIPLGLTALPLVVGQQRLNGSYEFVWSLPVPRAAAAAATFTVYTLIALPGTVLALLVGAWRYDAALTVRPSIVPAILLTSLMSASVGYGMAHAVQDPRVANLISNILIFFVLLFSPIVVPIAQFPHWLAIAHRWLPFYHMAVVIRAGLTTGLTSDLTVSYLVLGAWTVGSWLLAWRVISRRR